MDTIESAVSQPYIQSQRYLQLQFLLQTPGALNMKEWVRLFPLIASLTIKVRFTKTWLFVSRNKNFTAQRRNLLKSVKFIVSGIYLFSGILKNTSL
jgi:hypothetical protein